MNPRNLPNDPPPAIPSCPVCGQPMEYVEPGEFICVNPWCEVGGDVELVFPDDAVFSLAAYEADQRRRKARLDELDNAVEDDDDEDTQDEW